MALYCDHAEGMNWMTDARQTHCACCSVPMFASAEMKYCHTCANALLTELCQNLGIEMI